jgi:hypothetical protein
MERFYSNSAIRAEADNTIIRSTKSEGELLPEQFTALPDRNMHSPPNSVMLFPDSQAPCTPWQGKQMTYRITVIILALIFSLPAAADMLKGVDRMLCVPGKVSHCVADIGCNYELPEDENIPEFIEVDLKRKTVATTRASGEGRSTPIQNDARTAGYIYLQGVENGRTFSMVISENTGDLTFAVATDGETATMFGACTPD